MKKNHLFIVIVISFGLAIFGNYIYSYNQDFQQSLVKYQSDVESTKNKQSDIDKQFEQTQQQKEKSLEQQEISQKLKDEDGDGLTYEQEVGLGTSDNERDTDGDGIDDNEDKHPAGGGQTQTITVYWTHQGLTYSTQFGIAEDKYWHYKSQERSSCCDDWTKFVTPYDPTIQTIAQDVADVSISKGDSNKAQIAINFVESMIYEYDIEYISQPEWPKYPIETIIDQRGDCEDTSFLMASILEALNYDTIILIYSDHAAIGVWCDSCYGTYYNYKGKKYFFLETTGYADNWEIGKIWGKYGTESPLIIDT
ncbi:MAG: hypothetical protein KJ771_08950 [Nanoarchaeota archaeon]|nr:hypothetical protein [Nanoarchaeota archaeon]